MDVIWFLGGTVAYKDGTWTTIEAYSNFSGYATVGPNVSQLPAICDMLNSIGFTVTPTVDDSIASFVYRFSVVDAETNDDVLVLSDTDVIDIETNNAARVTNALITNRDFLTYFNLYGTFNVPMSVALRTSVGQIAAIDVLNKNGVVLSSPWDSGNPINFGMAFEFGSDTYITEVQSKNADTDVLETVIIDPPVFLPGGVALQMTFTLPG